MKMNEAKFLDELLAEEKEYQKNAARSRRRRTRESRYDLETSFGEFDEGLDDFGDNNDFGSDAYLGDVVDGDLEDQLYYPEDNFEDALVDQIDMDMGNYAGPYDDEREELTADFRREPEMAMVESRKRRPANRVTERHAKARHLLNEANGSVDKLYGILDKSISTAKSAVSGILDVLDVLDDALLEATAIGGKIGEVLPGQIKTLATNLNNLANQQLGSLIEGQNGSLTYLKDIVSAMPYRDIRPESKEERLANLTGQDAATAAADSLNLAPDLSNGPQSAVMESKETGLMARIAEAVGPVEPMKVKLNEKASGSTAGITYNSPVDIAKDLNLRETTRVNNTADEAPVEGKLDFDNIQLGATLNESMGINLANANIVDMSNI